MNNRVLFVSNGHGEEAIAARIAEELATVAPEILIDHLALVGDFGHPSVMRDVGPRRRMPSGGLIAMGNLKNISRDLRSGLIGLGLKQLRFLRSARKVYALVVAVGDVFALFMALQAKLPTVFVGTAKSTYVAPYGPFERRILGRAAAVFVRDLPTARALNVTGLSALAPGNVIVDLFAMQDDPRAQETVFEFVPALGLFPGSRQSAYFEAKVLASVTRQLARARPRLGAALSIAPGLDVPHFVQAFAADGWNVRERDDVLMPFILCDGEREIIRAWRGGIGPLLSRVTLVIGQAGTANEAAAAAGIPVVALDLTEDHSAWYRKRQRGLLGDALLVVGGTVSEVTSEVGDLLDDPLRRAHMSHVGKERMGAPGGARAIAQNLAALLGGFQ